MQNIKILNSKEKKQLLNEIEEQYKTSKLYLDYVFLKNNEGKLFLISNYLKNLKTDDLRINAIGLYFANISKGIRLSIEGSQLVGDKAKKFIELNDEQIKDWIRGFDVTLDSIKNMDDLKGFVLIKNKDDFYGTGFLKDNKILNYVPRERRIKNL
ncbi:MAG: hypothetical protein V1663_01395 [archaeon]